MSGFINPIYVNYTNAVKMSIFDFFKTGNIIYDSIISTVALSLFGFIFNYIYENKIDKLLSLKLYDLKSLIYKKNVVVIEGRRCTLISQFLMSQNITSIYSNRFKAMWEYIINNIENNDSIYSIKESHTNYQSSSSELSEKRKPLDIFMVYQNTDFKIDHNIYVKAEIQQEDSRDCGDGDKGKTNTKTDKITINIYSYVYSLSYLKKYIDDITDKYLLSIKNNRINQRFIYMLDKVKLGEQEPRFNCWREDVFESSRNFQNMFFDGKIEVLKKIDFFINNRDWYYEKGIPYSLGIGLHGPPGTGKTSFIKALANYTNRNIVVISLKIFTSKRQVEQFFFENTYNERNEIGSVTFDKKIIVFEDIDCIGDIVLDRNRFKKEEKTKNDLKPSDDKLTQVLESFCKINESSNIEKFNDDHSVTLDDILNLWDGIRETPGRILIISSNHYDKLDPALTRPGRIDITHELSNASHNTISELYFHLFGKNINNTNLKKIREYFYSPAELINIYVSHKTEEEFIKRLIENKKC
jgi:hypothetical protein